MGYNMGKKRGCGGESAEETLKGKNRELQKIIRHLEHKIAELENQLEMSASLIDSTVKIEKPIKNKQKNEKKCENCGKGGLEKYVLETPHKKMVFEICKLCKHRKRIV